MISRKVARLFKKTFGFRDIEAMLQAFEEASNVVECEYTKTLLASFPSFIDMLDLIYAEHDDKHRQALRNLHISSDELNETNFALESLNISMNAVLQSLGQGLLFFDKTGVCAPVYSQSCLHLLEKEPSNKSITDVLDLRDDEASSMQSLISLVFNPDAGALSFDDLIGLAPQNYNHSNDLLISLTYRPMKSKGGLLTGILVIATDITAEAAAQEALKQQEIETERILRIARNKEDYIRQLKNFETAITTLKEERPLDDIERDMHTLKSMAKVFNLDDMAEILHHLEDALRDITAVEGDFASFMRVLANYQKNLDKTLKDARDYGRQLWGADFEEQKDIITVETSDLLAFAKVIKEFSPEDLKSGDATRLFFDTVASTPVYNLLHMFETQMEYFAEMSSKMLNIKHTSNNDVRIFPDFYKNFSDSLVHIARNIVDHAADTPENRERQGKTPELLVSIASRYCDDTHNSFEITITDDGKGINVDKIASKLKNKMPENEFSKLSPEDIMQYIFSSGLSTQDSVTLTSGRGVGLNVVKDEVEKLGGSVHVSSQLGQGTTFTLIIPAIWEKEHNTPQF